MKNKEIFDVLIVGAGPSGSNTAISYKTVFKKWEYQNQWRRFSRIRK